MPKAKSNRGVAKRVRVSKKGKVKFRHSFTSHLMSSRDANRRVWGSAERGGRRLPLETQSYVAQMIT